MPLWRQSGRSCTLPLGGAGPGGAGGQGTLSAPPLHDSRV